MSGGGMRDDQQDGGAANNDAEAAQDQRWILPQRVLDRKVEISKDIQKASMNIDTSSDGSIGRRTKEGVLAKGGDEKEAWTWRCVCIARADEGRERERELRSEDEDEDGERMQDARDVDAMVCQ